MKILKLPFETIINCECGCEFEFDDIGIRTERIFCESDYINIRKMLIKCPFCCKDIILSKR